jgi:hypothetical protein
MIGRRTVEGPVLLIDEMLRYPAPLGWISWARKTVLARARRASPRRQLFRSGVCPRHWVLAQATPVAQARAVVKRQAQV